MNGIFWESRHPSPRKPYSFDQYKKDRFVTDRKGVLMSSVGG